MNSFDHISYCLLLRNACFHAHLNTEQKKRQRLSTYVCSVGSAPRQGKGRQGSAYRRWSAGISAEAVPTPPVAAPLSPARSPAGHRHQPGRRQEGSRRKSALVTERKRYWLRTKLRVDRQIDPKQKGRGADLGTSPRHPRPHCTCPCCQQNREKWRERTTAPTILPRLSSSPNRSASNTAGPAQPNPLLLRWMQFTSKTTTF